MERRGENELLVGVDGGATEVKAHAIVEVQGGLAEGAARAGFRYERAAEFEPVDLERQLAEHARGDCQRSKSEREQGQRWIDAFVNAIESVAARAGNATIRIGVCAPGLKTLDGRGIAVAKNGPRIPDFTDHLEAALLRTGLVLAAPVPPLVSDGFACGLGEKASPQGGFAGISSAYYIGGGTGIAECFVLDGRVVSMDEVADVSRKAWAMTGSLGRDYEAHLSMRGINARFVELGGSADVMPEQAVARGDRLAERTFHECAAMFAELVRARARELREARGIELERVVVGQRLGALFADPALCTALREPAERATGVPIQPSTLRAAPAIGAARWALDQSERGETHAR